MPPTPTPTESDIESVRKIARLKSYTTAETLVNALNDSQWVATLDDIDEWDGVQGKHTKIKAGLLGANIDPEEQRLAITNRVRERIGLDPVTLVGTVIGSSGVAASVPVAADF